MTTWRWREKWKKQSGGCSALASRRIEDQLDRLSALRDTPPEEAQAALAKALENRVNLVIAKAAKVSAGLQLRALIPNLVRAFERLMESAVERDPQCWGKNAIAEALVDLDYRDSAVFLQGLRHVQMEPGWGGPGDTAQALRGICVSALPCCTDLPRREILRHLVDSLADAAAPVRADALCAVEQMGGEEAALLLRLKARSGDKEARITGHAFECLLRIERQEALGFVSEFLDSRDDEVREEAALALGASRVPKAFDILRKAWTETRDLAFRRVLLRSISALRRPLAIEFLLSLLKSGRDPDAADARAALALHCDSEEIQRLIEDATKK
jgi:HEAT repeat protein